MVNGRILGILFMVIFSAGCASPPTPYIPPDLAHTSKSNLSGPVAVLEDSAVRDGVGQARIFVAEQVSGQAVENIRTESLAVGRGKGLVLTLVMTDRNVPAGSPLSTVVSGAFLHNAPIQSLLADANYAAEGVIQWTPKAGERYVVKGLLSAAGSTVWIEEKSTGLRMGLPVVGSPSVKGPQPTFSVPKISVRFECGECNVRPDAGFLIEDEYVRSAITAGASLSKDSVVEVVVDVYHARDDLTRIFAAAFVRNDQIRAKVALKSGTVFVEDYYRTNYFGADRLARNIGAAIFEKVRQAK